jgi:hypothetical protein
MDGEDSFPCPALLDPDHGVGREPVVSMNHIKMMAHVILGLEEVMDKGPAHVVDFLDKVRVQVEGTAMVMDSINPLVPTLSLTHAGENVDLMPFSLQGSSQLGDVNPHTSNGDGVQRLP